MRFSLRGLIVLVLIVGCWLGWMVRSAQIQRAAVAAIERSGGWVWYDWHFNNGSVVRNAKPWAPKWLVDRVGVDYFGDVVFVGLRGQGSDAELIHVGHLSRLETLILDTTHVNDVGIARAQRTNAPRGAGPRGHRDR